LDEVRPEWRDVHWPVGPGAAAGESRSQVIFERC